MKKPFFGKRKKPIKEPSSFVAVPSPGKHIGLRSECIDQFKKWHKLLEIGAISQLEYNKLQQKILSDIKQLLLITFHTILSC